MAPSARIGALLVAALLAVAGAERGIASLQTAQDTCGAQPRTHLLALLGQGVLGLLAASSLAVATTASRRTQAALLTGAALAVVAGALVFLVPDLMAFELGDC